MSAPPNASRVHPERIRPSPSADVFECGLTSHFSPNESVTVRHLSVRDAEVAFPAGLEPSTAPARVPLVVTG